MNVLATEELSKFLNATTHLVRSFNKGGAAGASKNLITCPRSKRVSHSSYARRGMRRLLAVVFICVTALVLVVYQLYVHPERLYTFRDLTRETNSTPVILVWTSYFSEKVWIPKTLSELGCKQSQCKTTYDRASIPSSSVVVFHWRSINLDDLPTERPTGQLWALFNEESPPHTPRYILDELSDRFNWTITYRRDSDFWAPYGKVLPGGTNVTQQHRPAKKSLVAWLVSNCKTESSRESYVEELSMHIPVSVYGACGKAYCTQQSAAQCYKKLARKYMFYLSFENSICKDYVTEKLFYPMINGMVPIVFGGADYSEILPPNSYVDALNFTSPKKLAEYLKDVANDTQKYDSYFQWNKRYTATPWSYSWVCDICEKLHQTNLSAPARDLSEWWYGRSNCRTWRDGKVLPTT